MDKAIIEYFLPNELLNYFKIIQVEEVQKAKAGEVAIRIELEEINTIPQGYASKEYESKGFYPIKEIQDFPIRGKAVYLAIKRRRWRHKERKNEIIHNDYSFFAEGSKLTKELSNFLKATGRDPRRYDK